MANDFVPPEKWFIRPTPTEEKPKDPLTTLFAGGFTSARYPTSMTHATPNISNLGVTLSIVNPRTPNNPSTFTVLQLEKSGLIPSFIKALTVNNIQTSPTLSGVMYTYIFPPSAFKCVIAGYILRNEVGEEITTTRVGDSFVTVKRTKNIQANPFSMLVRLATLVAASYYGALCRIDIRNVLTTVVRDNDPKSKSYGQMIETDTTTDSMYLLGFLENVGFEFSDTENKIGKFELHFHCYP